MYCTVYIKNQTYNWLSSQNNTRLAAFTFLTLELKTSIRIPNVSNTFNSVYVILKNWSCSLSFCEQYLIEYLFFTRADIPCSTGGSGFLGAFALVMFANNCHWNVLNVQEVLCTSMIATHVLNKTSWTYNILQNIFI